MMAYLAFHVSYHIKVCLRIETELVSSHKYISHTLENQTASHDRCRYVVINSADRELRLCSVVEKDTGLYKPLASRVNLQKR